MTGLPCSGKTTIARKLQEVYPKLALLDGDELREWLSPKDFSRDGRNEHNRRVAHLAKLLLKHNVDVVFIPNRGKTVTIKGQIRREGYYELKSYEGLIDLIKILQNILLMKINRHNSTRKCNTIWKNVYIKQ